MRARPLPTEDSAPAVLSVEVLEPRQRITVVASRALTIRVSARDLSGSRLTGLGYVVRRGGTAGSAAIDSAAVRFNGTTRATHEFAVGVPAQRPSSAQLDIFGLALGTSTQARASEPRSIIVARCEPLQPGC